MKFRVFAFLGAILMAGSLSAQTLTDVINEFNTGVEKLNNQEYQPVLAVIALVGRRQHLLRMRAVNKALIGESLRGVVRLSGGR